MEGISIVKQQDQVSTAVIFMQSCQKNWVKATARSRVTLLRHRPTPGLSGTARQYVFAPLEVAVVAVIAGVQRQGNHDTIEKQRMRNESGRKK
jgi:hypothetical protein